MISTPEQSLILIDGSSYFFRAFHALPPLMNSKGKPTGAVFGVVNMIRRLLKDYRADYVAVVFDTPGKTFRDELYPEYKANRPPMPDDLRCQYEPMIHLIKALGLPVVAIDGVEADDVIGTLAHEATRQGKNVLISTGDKDMAQLVNATVTLINTMSQKLMTPEGVIEKFGVRADQMIDYLTLVGDTVDNVPGVNKCGPKTAAKWLNEYQTLDNLILHANDIGGKIGEYLREAISRLGLSKTLVTIKTDVELPFHFNELQLGVTKEQDLVSILKDLEFKNWLKEVIKEEDKHSHNETVPSAQNSDFSPTTHFDLVTTKAQLQAWVDKLNASKEFCVDLETTSLNPLEAQIVGIALALSPTEPAYIPLMHHDQKTSLDKKDVLAILKPILENPKIYKIGQNLKYDDEVFKNEGIFMQGIQFDTMLESYVLNSSATRHDLDTLALKYLGYKTITFEDIAGKGVKQKRFDDIDVAIAAPYAAEDASVTFKLHHTLYPMLEKRQKEVFEAIEMPLLPVLSHMETLGVLIDKDVLALHGQRLKVRILELEKEAYDLAGGNFNLSSPKQLQEILYDKLSLPILAKTPTGQPSTAEPVLQELAYDYRLPALILEYRSLTKLVSTYIDALPKKINPKTNRVHTSYNQAVTATGRLSSSDPNLQNIPARSEEGRLIRTAFIAPKDQVILAADYSQIELRIMAHLSGDENLWRAFQNGWDIHTATAAEIFGVSQDEVTNEQRRRAKAVNFGLIYGMSAFGLSKQIGVSRQEAEHYIDTYFKRYPGVLAYMERTRQFAHEHGYVETLLGRRLYLPEINVKNMARRKAAERMAINAPMQGTAADIIKLAMIAINQWQHETTHPIAKLIMQVHDELVFEVQADKVEEAKEKIRTLMEHSLELAVPLIVSIGVGQNWDQAH